MNNALTLSNSRLSADTPLRAIRKAAKKAAGKPGGHPHPKKHGAPGHEKHEKKDKHDDRADLRRAHLHLARASSLLAVLPKAGTMSELKKLHLLCRDIAEAEPPSPRAAAEAARALEHLCFVGLGAVHSDANNPMSKELHRDFKRHLQHDLEKQADHLERVAAIAGPQDGKGPLPSLLALARQSLATARQMVRDENWYLAHECLRTTGALAGAIDHL